MTASTSVLTWKWFVGVLLALAGALATVTYAAVDHRISSLESDGKSAALQLAEANAMLAALQQEVKDMREAEEDLAAQLHILLGTQLHKSLR